MKKDRSDWGWGHYRVEDQSNLVREEYAQMTPRERLSLPQYLSALFYGDDATQPRLLADSDSAEIRHMLFGVWALSLQEWPNLIRD
ncbi:MAG: hypothetical protein P1U58_02630 [Verrucomicrobiales bacterium]|nr:hypothetical protein [Verrucomicrobiales bacterium]